MTVVTSPGPGHQLLVFLYLGMVGLARDHLLEEGVKGFPGDRLGGGLKRRHERQQLPAAANAPIQGS